MQREQRRGDLTICTNSTQTHFIQVGHKIMQLDVLPFLTNKQLQNGHEESWFNPAHLKELLTLLRPKMEESVYKPVPVEVQGKKPPASKDCVLTGENVRFACTFKQIPVHNICLLPKKGKPKKKATDGTFQKYVHRPQHQEKLVAFVCLRAQSTVLQLSQLIKDDSERDSEDISHYFTATTASKPSVPTR